MNHSGSFTMQESKVLIVWVFGPPEYAVGIVPGAHKYIEQEPKSLKKSPKGNSSTRVVVKIMVPFWVMNMTRHLISRDPKGDHHFDKHPHASKVQVEVKLLHQSRNKRNYINCIIL